ncbi:MAG: bifunctional [glutamate--ammonia ligase]-adenylyl-L-tyrosine phosphorylase/[glutamate--ammonia-ligase] adenylyltransferase [Pseudomonadales bacterium]|nr:bifunctional [glutamate--ammonia ligase]-adenylyl-L-tyrosine phosphorylase/[glutamate--ammonia-ligase] adenylyltransferase [Pseudomonadales bacterium]MCP5183344.1 bifunctional [glutamate--ammonia ligase]-adenylyl-L-tyrosine phosphorylase/[glutamate--ammonia-ligase] adenylyltransferase [Pseudomonadales bacterium]
MSSRHLTPLPQHLETAGQALCASLDLAPTPSLVRVFTLSPFAAGVAQRQTQAVREMVERGVFDQRPDSAWYAHTLAATLAETPTMDGVKRLLRQMRNLAQFHLIYRHVLATSVMTETVADVSALADVFVQAALDWCDRTLAATPAYGEPRTETGERQHLVVFALGKLGAGELNLSSDIDLVLAYPEAGVTTTGKTCQQYFVRLAQMLVDALDPITVDGFVYRVDLRLRPWGESGPLVMHFDAMESYFETQGRDWERYAFIKARACAGDLAAGDTMLARLQPFVYRRYLDFGAVQALRDMKARIQAEKHGPRNIKLGPGGIRDIEFGVQVMQLIWGGRQPELRTRALMQALPQLVGLNHLDATVAADLLAAYEFLRDLEHCLQAVADEQTQLLPTDDDALDGVALMLGYADRLAMRLALDEHRTKVSAFFTGVIAPVEVATTTVPWDEIETTVQAHQFGEAEIAARELEQLRTARDRSSVGNEGRQRLDALMPALLEDLRGQVDAGVVLSRLVPILRSVLRRSAYLALLHENPDARRLLVELVRRSRWVAERLCAQPMHMDALLDERGIDDLPTTAALRQSVRQRLAAVDADDQERRLDVLREFREQYGFGIALAELRAKLPLMRISDYYTFLAEALLQEALEMAWADIGGPHHRPFIVVGYGKLGGLELGPDSDLDLVFLHDFPPDEAPMLQRLARRLLHILTASTYLGALYEIDTRLRPSGNAGTMVTSLAGFETYQRQRAWTWEHQALVRARCVAGDPALRERFETLRRALLCEPRDRDKVREDVAAMRERMVKHHKAEADLKRSAGGIVDIEFMVQYLVLAHAAEHPALAVFPDNVRILEAAGASGVLARETAEALTAAYLALRAENHRRALDLPDRERAERLLRDHEALVRGTWVKLFSP